MASEERSLKGLLLFLFIGAVIVGIILAVPLIWKPNLVQDSYRYNYFDFEKKSGVWTTQTEEGGNPLLVQLRHGPRELEDISVVGNIQNFKDYYDFVYVTFDPRVENHDGFVTMATAEVSPAMVVHFGKDILAACTVDYEDCVASATPIVTCNSTNKGVIFINNNDDNYIRVDGNCATISGTGTDLVRAADRFLYGMYGIMK